MSDPNQPLAHLDDWEESLLTRYPAEGSAKAKEQFRDYRAEAGVVASPDPQTELRSLARLIDPSGTPF